MDKFIENYEGYAIFLQEGDGFYWSNQTGTFVGDGFFDSISETKRSIDKFKYSERQAFPEFYQHNDTPCLPPLPEK